MKRGNLFIRCEIGDRLKCIGIIKKQYNEAPQVFKIFFAASKTQRPIEYQLKNLKSFRMV